MVAPGKLKKVLRKLLQTLAKVATAAATDGDPSTPVKPAPGKPAPGKPAPGKPAPDTASNKGTEDPFMKPIVRGNKER